MTRVALQPRVPTADLLGFALELQRRHEAQSSTSVRKARGQFFTPPSVAAFMARLFSTFPRELRVLDPGAGTGTLSAAICQEILRLRSPRHVEFVLYETDPDVIALLAENMAHCRSVLARAGHRVQYAIQQRDFVLSAPSAVRERTLFDAPGAGEQFDAVIMNPPYYKIAGDSEHARAMGRVVHGQPNIYALFLALAAELLRPEGELVAITPRSFTNGPYFRDFRRWFLQHVRLQHIHLFESRRETFREADVLQESIITLVRKTTRDRKSITVSTSFGRDLDEDAASMEVPASTVIDDSSSDLVIRIPENRHDARIVKLIASWPRRFTDHGLRVSTGKVVLFRARQFLLASPHGASAVPLLSIHNVRPFHTLWPLTKGNKPLAFKACPASRQLLVPAKNYVLVRRFSAKEERRRLTASCFLKDSACAPMIALENHLNYVYHAERDLSEDEVYGLAALLNAALFDRYFRAVSGNTQVNAAEIRSLPLPDLETVARIGKRVRGLSSFVRGASEHVVLRELGINGALETYLEELAL
jgi:adenine-specific DNA-methyltransferase